MPMKIAVFNQKGGVGKTTLSIILTQIALMKKQRVLAVDQDEQCNFFTSMHYLEQQRGFKDLFTFKTSLTAQDFQAQVDMIIIDCPSAFNERSIFAIKNADFVVIPVTPDIYSTLHIQKIHKFAGDSKQLYQLPIVTVGFTDNVISRVALETISRKRNPVMMGLPVYAKIAANISSGKHKWWSVGLKSSERAPFEFVYTRLVLLNEKLQAERRKKSGWNTSVYDYYDDPENPDLKIV